MQTRTKFSEDRVAWIAKLSKYLQRILEGQIPDCQQAILIHAPGVLQDLRPMRPALFVRKQIFYRRSKLIVPLGEDEGILPQGAVESIELCWQIAYWGF